MYKAFNIKSVKCSQFQNTTVSNGNHYHFDLEAQKLHHQQRVFLAPVHGWC